MLSAGFLGGGSIGFSCVAACRIFKMCSSNVGESLIFDTSGAVDRVVSMSQINLVKSLANHLTPGGPLCLATLAIKGVSSGVRKGLREVGGVFKIVQKFIGAVGNGMVLLAKSSGCLYRYY